jgi:site-specific recombinase XerD
VWPGARPAGPSRQSPGAGAGPAPERSGAALITAAEVSSWVGSLVARGLAPSTVTRALATLRSVLAFAVADGRVQHNVAATARRPTSGRARREGQGLTSDELRALMKACKGRYRDVVPVLALAGLR